ncbi:MAG TPA: ferredoxin [Oceanipulchritudo sp.]|nr:ferredoxin [Oceanipulchritudo sp.]
MKLIRIAHKKPDCIGCALCAEVAPNYFRMDGDGEAELIRITREDNSFQYGEGFEEDRGILEEAESGCPVDIIRIDK